MAYALRGGTRGNERQIADVIRARRIISDLSLIETLEVTETTTLSGSMLFKGVVEIKGALDVTGQSIFNGDISTNGNIDVTGDTTLGGLLEVSDNATFSSNVGISGDLVVDGSLTYSGSLGLSGNLNLSGDLNVAGDTTLGGLLEVSDNATFSSNVGISGDLVVDGSLTYSGSLNLSGDIEISNNLYLGDTLIMDPVRIGISAGFITQGSRGVAIGYQAGLDNQGVRGIAIGEDAGSSFQGEDSIALGYAAGGNQQAQRGIAVGRESGSSFQGADSIAIGNRAGQLAQGPNNVAIGNLAGQNNQGFIPFVGGGSVAIGFQSGNSQQKQRAVAIGQNSGGNTQGEEAVAIGFQAGINNQGDGAIAIGKDAGYTSQGVNGIAIGVSAVLDGQSQDAIAIGTDTAIHGQGQNSIAIGTGAGTKLGPSLPQPANTIVLNATGSSLPGIASNLTSNATYIAPIRGVSNPLGGTIGGGVWYNTTTKEICYQSPLTSDVSFSGDVDIQNNLQVLNDLFVQNNLDICGDENVYGNVHALGDLFVQNNLDVCGGVSIYGNIQALDDLFVQNNLDVCGGVSIYGNIQALDDLFVQNNLDVCGDGRVYGDLRVDGSFNIGPASVSLWEDASRLNIREVGGGGFVFDFTNTDRTVLRHYGTDTPQIVIDDAGRIGIGKHPFGFRAIDVSGVMSVGSNDVLNSQLFLVDDDVKKVFIKAKDDNFSLETSGRDLFLCQTAGAVGIGTINPLSSTYKLDVNGSTRIRDNLDVCGDGRVYGDFRVDGSFNIGPASVSLWEDAKKLNIRETGGGGIILDFSDSGETVIRHYSVSTPQITIDSSGRVGIGKLATAPYSLDVSGTIKADSFEITGGGFTFDHLAMEPVIIGTDNYTTHGSGTVSIGISSGAINQSQDSIAIGKGAGLTNQGANSLAIGKESGRENQGQYAISIGQYAGYNNQHSGSIILNATGTALNSTDISSTYIAPIRGASNPYGGIPGGGMWYNTATKEVTYQTPLTTDVSFYGDVSISENLNVSGNIDVSGKIVMDLIRIGISAGDIPMVPPLFIEFPLSGICNEDCIAIGNHAGRNEQLYKSIAIGSFAGEDNQGLHSVAIGSGAGNTYLTNAGVAIGFEAGFINNTNRTVSAPDSTIAIGNSAGREYQKKRSIAIGTNAGYENQGEYSIAIGSGAGETNQHNQSIVLNATGTTLNSTDVNSLYIAPIRGASNPYGGTPGGGLWYNTTTKEVNYQSPLTNDVSFYGDTTISGDGRVYGDFRVDGSFNIGPASITMWEDDKKLIMKETGGGGLIYDFTNVSQTIIKHQSSLKNQFILKNSGDIEVSGNTIFNGTVSYPSMLIESDLFIDMTIGNPPSIGLLDRLPSVSLTSNKSVTYSIQQVSPVSPYTMSTYNNNLTLNLTSSNLTTFTNIFTTVFFNNSEAVPSGNSVPVIIFNIPSGILDSLCRDIFIHCDLRSRENNIASTYIAINSSSRIKRISPNTTRNVYSQIRIPIDITGLTWSDSQFYSTKDLIHLKIIRHNTTGYIYLRTPKDNTTYFV